MASNSTAAGDEHSIVQHGFKISTRKLPILKAGPIEAMSKKLGITPPEMIFGDNLASIEHLESGWALAFNAFDALDLVDKTDSKMLQVSYSKEWQDNRKHVHSEIKDVIKPFDWSYTTDYKGTVACPSPNMAFVPTDMHLPIHLLKIPDPILFYSSVDLFEDELADNGMSLLTVKIRVMPQRMLLLARFFLRLDGVIFRIRDTRVYIEFEPRLVLREYTAREESYEAIKQKLGARHDVAGIMRDPDKLSALCPVVESSTEQLVLPQKDP